ncbi:MAG: hypothetical protein E6314_22535, partial [Enterobacter sp.]|nr:hypothetical protein [Enterobacter sp.]
TLNHPKRFVDNAQRLPAFAAVCFSVNNMHIFPVKNLARMTLIFHLKRSLSLQAYVFSIHQI